MKNPIPSPEELTAPAIDELVRLRPGAVRHIERGAYGHIAMGLKSQTRVYRRDLARLLNSRFLASAEGQELLTLARSSEFGAPVEDGPTTACGYMVLQRAVADATTANPADWLTQGVIPTASLFRVQAQSGPPRTNEFTIETTETAIVGNTAADGVVTTLVAPNTWRHEQFVSIATKAQVAGPGGNLPVFGGAEAFSGATTATAVAVAPLFDKALTSFSVFSAGGTAGISALAIRQAATNAYRGKRGAIAQAAKAASLFSGLGVEHLAYFDDTITRRSMLYIADASWGSNPRWCAQVSDRLKAKWIGFGCRVTPRPIVNVRAVVRFGAVLEDSRFLEQADAIASDASIALRSYFDDRPNFHQVSTSEAASIVAKATAGRVLAVPQLEFTDEQGVLLPSMTAIPSGALAHLFLTGVKITYYDTLGRPLLRSY